MPASNRQGYGLTEKDPATGLNHTWFRKNENRAGRWTSPDPYNGSASVGNPQSWNRYSYVESQPTNYVDPSGLLEMVCGWRVVTGTGVCVDGNCETSVQYAFVCWFEGGGGGRRVPGDIVISGGGHYDPKRTKDLPTTKSNDCGDLEQNIIAVLEGKVRLKEAI
ncbi:MAG: hypothetical protein IPJ30_03385 [Acidobacteria bacterium]|nr:hypothetical protein [Acidobacteriota bacterium]